MNQDYLGQAFGLAGRTALVTGARGLGYAIAAGLGRAGARDHQRSVAGRLRWRLRTIGRGRRHGA
ncbi:hypothetical protein WJ969_31010 [Achromobacter xylosoxidans]